MPTSESRETDVCSFCKKDARQRRVLIAGPGVNICDECVEVCVNVVHEVRSSALPREGGGGGVVASARWPGHAGSSVVCTRCRMPTPTSEALLIENEGVLCRSCVAEIHATFPKVR